SRDGLGGLFVAVELDLRVFQGGLILGHLPLGLRELDLERPRVDLDQEVTLFDELAFLERDLVDLAIHAGADGDVVQRRHGAEACEVDGEVTPGRGHGDDGRAAAPATSATTAAPAAPGLILRGRLGVVGAGIPPVPAARDDCEYDDYPRPPAGRARL